mgnify:CR=1 FL=1
MAEHPDIDMISFTGSTRAGVDVAKRAAPTVKRVSQELGGKSPNIILEGADLTKAVTGGVMHMFNNSGQSCNAPSRMIVPLSKMKEVAAIAATVAGRFDHFILTRAHKAGADVALFTEIFRKHGSDVTLAVDTTEAARMAKERAQREGMSVLALGGLFLSAEVQRAWNGGDPTSLEFL